MALSLSVTAFPQMILRDWRANPTLVSIIASSAMSRLVTAQMLSANPGGWAFDAKIPLMQKTGTNALISDGYQQAASYPSSNFDPTTVTYSKPSEGTVQPTIDRIALATTQLAELDLANHQAGNQILQVAISDAVAQINDQMSSMVALELIASGQREAGSGAGTSFGLDFSSDSNLLADLKQLGMAREKQTSGSSGNWILALNPIYRPQFAFVSSGTLGSRDYTAESNFNLREGSAGRVAGFDLVFDSAVPTGGGAAFSLDKVALMIPRAPVTKEFNESATPLSRFYSTHMLWGFTTLGKTISAYDDVAVSNAVQKEGIIKLAIT